LIYRHNDMQDLEKKLKQKGKNHYCIYCWKM
jgi:7-keto-8-aminopelargonate synthetase-like enzyme